MQSFFYCSQTYTYIQIEASERSIIGLKLYYLHAIQRYNWPFYFSMWWWAFHCAWGEESNRKNWSISSLCGSSCHGIGYVFIARVCSNVNSICFIGIFFFARCLNFFLFTGAYDSVNKDKQQFCQRFIFFCSAWLKRISAKNKGFFLLFWSIIKLEKNHWDCSGHKRTKWIYKNTSHRETNCW